MDITIPAKAIAVTGVILGILVISLAISKIIRDAKIGAERARKAKKKARARENEERERLLKKWLQYYHIGEAHRESFSSLPLEYLQFFDELSSMSLDKAKIYVLQKKDSFHSRISWEQFQCFCRYVICGCDDWKEWLVTHFYHNNINLRDGESQ